MDTKPLPDAGEDLTPGDVSEALCAALPQDEQANARNLLEERILPAVVSQANEDVGAAALLRMIYGDVRDRFAGVRESQRLAILKYLADVKEVEHLHRSALSAAVRRYGLEHDDARAAASEWSGTSPDWDTLTEESIADDASDVLDSLEAWAERVKQDSPDTWKAYRMEYVHGKLAAQSARSGSFETAAGNLGDFLTSVGASFESLSIH